MKLRLFLLIAAIICFTIAAASAASGDVNVNEGGFVAAGLAAFAGAVATG